MSGDTITIPDATDDEARVLLAVKLAEAGFDYYADGVFWELEGQTITVLLTEKHNDVMFFGNETLRIHYDTPQLLLGDWDALMGGGDVEGMQEVVEENDEVPNYQTDAPPEATPDPTAPGPVTVTTPPAVRDGF